MADNQKNLLTLAKVLIAAAWADGEITVEEQNCLKDIIFHLTDTGTPLSGQEWALLEMYMDSPIVANERARLVTDLQPGYPARAQFHGLISTSTWRLVRERTSSTSSSPRHGPSRRITSVL